MKKYNYDTDVIVSSYFSSNGELVLFDIRYLHALFLLFFKAVLEKSQIHISLTKKSIY